MARPPQGRLIWHLACDESGIHGSASHYGFGSLWMRWQRRGDFSRDLQDLKSQHGYEGEIKWTKVKPKVLPFYVDLVDYFFRTHWLAFHCFVVDKRIVRRELHGGDWDLARRKHFTTFVFTKVRTCINRHSSRECVFRMSVDPIPSRYAKADECVGIIANNQLMQHFRTRNQAIESVRSIDSKENLRIQLCDVLIGAVMSAWNKETTSAPKSKMLKTIAGHLGWPDLEGDTWPKERKFNIWYFHDLEKERRARTRTVKLRYPLPESRKHPSNGS